MPSAPDIPGYTLLGVLGHGGFSTVYRAHQHAVDREVAVKVDNRVLAAERDRRRYLREVSAAGRLSGHPHVVAVFDAGTLGDGRPYLVMDLCPGGSLDQLLRRDGPLPVDTVLTWGGQLADALDAAHAAGILHRDIKPGNLMLGRYGQVGLADFGLASILAADQEQSVTREALTPAYAPPEAFRLAEPSPAGDLYSLGATLYALLCGRPPRFPPGPAPSIHTILTLHDQPVPDLPGVPAALSAVLRRALDSDPARRQPSAAVLRDELAAIGTVGPVAPGPARPHPVPAPPADPWAAPPVPPSPPVPPGQNRPDAGPPATDPWAAPPSVPSPSVPAPSGAPSAGPAPGGAPLGPTPTVRAPGLPSRQVDGPRPTRSRGWTAPVAAAIAVLVLGGGLFVWLAPGRDVPVTTPSGGASAASAGSGTKPAGTGTGAGNGGTAAGGPRTIGDGEFAVAVSTQGCPAAAVAGADAGCPVDPECWDGLVDNAGDVTVRDLGCTEAHTWQTFAVLPFPDALTGPDSRRVAAAPAVKAACTAAILTASLNGAGKALPAGRWTVDVLPPSKADYRAGSRVVRCLGGQGLDELTAPVFG